MRLGNLMRYRKNDDSGEVDGQDFWLIMFGAPLIGFISVGMLISAAAKNVTPVANAHYTSTAKVCSAFEDKGYDCHVTFRMNEEVDKNRLISQETNKDKDEADTAVLTYSAGSKLQVLASLEGKTELQTLARLEALGIEVEEAKGGNEESRVFVSGEFIDDNTAKIVWGNSTSEEE